MCASAVRGLVLKAIGGGRATSRDAAHQVGASNLNGLKEKDGCGGARVDEGIYVTM